MVFLSNVIAKENGRTVIDRNRHVHSAVVIEVAQGQTSARKRLGKNWTALAAYIAEAVALVLEKQQWLAVCEVIVDFLNEIIRGAVRNDEVEFSVLS